MILSCQTHLVEFCWSEDRDQQHDLKVVSTSPRPCKGPTRAKERSFHFIFDRTWFLIRGQRKPPWAFATNLIITNSLNNPKFLIEVPNPTKSGTGPGDMNTLQNAECVAVAGELKCSFDGGRRYREMFGAFRPTQVVCGGLLRSATPVKPFDLS